MPYIRLKNIGQIGVNKDLSQHEIPKLAWTDSANMRFIDGYARQFFGQISIYETVQNTPLHIFPVTIGTERHWIYPGASTVYDVYKNSGTGSIVHTDLTPGGGLSTVGANDWTSCVLGGIPVINNGSDVPQRWDLNLANNFQDLDNWPATYTCKVMRVFGPFLVALDIDKNGTRYPFMVKWSHPADPGSVPESWDETDPEYDAGEVDLAEGYDTIVDGLQLRDSFIIYKESSVWRMDLIGGPNVFSFKRVLGTSGALNRNCIVELDGYHFVLTGSDVIVHDGQSPKSVLDKMTRRYLFQDMDVDARVNSFVFKNPFFNEAYICYPQVGSTVPDKAMVWNYMDNTVSFTTLPNVYHANFGPDTNAIYTESWDSDPEAWDLDLTLWNNAEPVPRRAKVLMASSEPAIYLLDATAGDANASPGDNYIERQALTLVAEERRALIRGIRPVIKGSPGTTVTISVGGTDEDPFGTPEYDESVDFTIGQDIRAEFLVDRRYFAIKFANGTASQWRLDSFDIEYEETAEW